MPIMLQRFSSKIILIITLVLLAACGGGATVSGPVVVVQNDSGQPEPPSAPAVSSEGSEPVEDTSDDASDQNAGESQPVPSQPVPSQPPVPEELLAEDFDAPPPSEGSLDQVESPASDQQPEPPAAPKTYSVSDITDLILITGQSNALGADTTYDHNLDSPHERVFAFTEQGWLKADLHQVWDLGWFPRSNPGSEPSNNLAIHFGKEVVRRHSRRVVGIILAAAPGEGIDHWSANGDFFNQIDQKVIDAVNQTPHKSGLDGILWHQGESDEGDHDYHLKLDSLIDRFRQQSWFANDRPFICGETASFDVVNQQLMALNSDGDQWTACVRSGGLQTREDGHHFNAQGLRGLGRRYAERYLEVIR